MSNHVRTDGTVRGEKKTYSIDEVADLLGINRNSAYAAAGKDFPVIRIGKRLLVPKAALDRLLEGQAA